MNTIAAFVRAALSGIVLGIIDVWEYRRAYFWGLAAVVAAWNTSGAAGDALAAVLMCLAISSAEKTAKSQARAGVMAQIDWHCRESVERVLREKDFDPTDLARRLAASLGVDCGEVVSVKVEAIDGEPVVRRPH